jgi:pimeloyl-ACP methyl ester carboxylesterase
MFSEYESSYRELRGLRFHLVEDGPADGPLVVFLHGFPEFWYGWRGQIRPFAQAGYRVIVPDQRGYNLSDKPEGIAAYGIDELVADVIALMDSYDSRKAVLVGHDWGGAVAWQVALRHPERLEKFIAVNIPHPLVFARTLRQSWAQRRKSWYMSFFQIPRLPEWLLRLANWSYLTRSVVRSSRKGVFSESVLDRYREAWSQPGAITAMIHWYRAVRRIPGTRPPRRQVEVPTLIVWGARDHFLGVEMAQPSVELCDDGRLELLEEATHWVHHEEPERVNQLMLDFLKE